MPIEIEEGDFETLGKKSTDRALAGSARADQSNRLGAAQMTSHTAIVMPLATNYHSHTTFPWISSAASYGITRLTTFDGSAAPHRFVATIRTKNVPGGAVASSVVALLPSG